MTAFCPQHHLPLEFLIEHSAGTLDAPLALLTACHLTLCPQCRTAAGQLDEVGAALVSERQVDSQSAWADAAWQRLAGRLKDLPTVQAHAISPPRLEGVLPQALLECLPEQRVRWRPWLPGVKGMRLHLDNTTAALRLVKFAPGLRVPLHDHKATELVLVLDGVIHEAGNRYARGDVAIAEPGHAHEQIVDAGSECVALILNQGRLLPLTLGGRILKAITGV